MTGFASAAALLLALASGGWLALGLCLQGIARGSMIPITMFVLMETRDVDSKVMGAAGGLFFAAAETGGVLGPIVMGTTADLSGNFTPGLTLLSLVCLTAVGLVLLLARALRQQLVESPAA